MHLRLNVSRRVRVALTVWLVLFAVIVVAFNRRTPDWRGWYELTENGRHAEATVTRVEPQNHATCSYAFTVNGVAYHGSEQSCAEASHVAGEHTRVGDPIQITYDPSDPSVSTWGSSREQLEFALGFTLLVPILAGGFAFSAATRNPRWPRNRERR
jgi:hypothetical protein